MRQKQCLRVASSTQIWHLGRRSARIVTNDHFIIYYYAEICLVNPSDATPMKNGNTGASGKLMLRITRALSSTRPSARCMALATWFNSCMRKGG